ncbi:hypothetical protein NQZ68_009232 [Dissostichus eleginoides]|nr:hypothetical protein NQZ68_009232 [Dissostichus eleginoides]
MHQIETLDKPKPVSLDGPNLSPCRWLERRFVSLNGCSGQSWKGASSMWITNTSPKEAFADFSLYVLLNIPAHINTPGLYLFILQCC